MKKQKGKLCIFHAPFTGYVYPFKFWNKNFIKLMKKNGYKVQLMTSAEYAGSM